MFIDLQDGVGISKSSTSIRRELLNDVCDPANGREVVNEHETAAKDRTPHKGQASNADPVIINVTDMSGNVGDLESAMAKTPIKVTPAKVKTPAKSKTPARAKTPVKSKAPVKAETPLKPKTPAKAKTPVKRKTPVKSKTPVKAETPLKPNTPSKVMSKTPAKAKTPLKPKTPVKSKTPVKVEITLKPTPAEAKTPVRPKTPSKAKTPVNSKTPVKAKTPVKTQTLEDTLDVNGSKTPVKAKTPIKRIISVNCGSESLEPLASAHIGETGQSESARMVVAEDDCAEEVQEAAQSHPMYYCHDALLCIYVHPLYFAFFVGISTIFVHLRHHSNLASGR